MSLKPVVFAVASALLLGVGAARADVIFSPGPGSASDTDNVIFNACSGNVTGPALMVQGCLNTNHGVLVDFTGHENLLVAGGQAQIVAQDGAFDFLQINFDPLASSAFTALSFNVDTTATGSITLFADLVGGGTASQSFAVGQSGSNFFHVDSINGQVMRDVYFQTNAGAVSVAFNDVQQVRIGGAGSPLPEPGAVLLFGTVLAGVGFSSKRADRHRK